LLFILLPFTPDSYLNRYQGRKRNDIVNNESAVKITLSHLIAIIVAIIIGLGWLVFIKTSYADKDFEARLKILESKNAEMVSAIEKKGEEVLGR